MSLRSQRVKSFECEKNIQKFSFFFLRILIDFHENATFDGRFGGGKASGRIPLVYAIKILLYYVSVAEFCTRLLERTIKGSDLRFAPKLPQIAYRSLL